MKRFEDFGIEIIGTGPQIYTTCPQCRDSRKKKGAKCLSVNLDQQIWNCHHCGWSGSLKFGDDKNSRPFAWKVKTYRKPEFIASPPADALLTWFGMRGISERVVRAASIRLQSVYFPQLEESADAIVFPYYEGAEVVNCKYRGMREKVFRQEFDAKKILYGVNDIEPDQLVIVEGEIDKLSLAVVGITSCVSVPDGAPPAGSKSSDQKFEYLTNCEQVLTPLKKIILAVDNDGPGKTLEQELARRLGQERCWRVTWPDGSKDANDVLIQHGADTLRRCIQEAKPWPIDHVVYPGDLAEDLLALRDQRETRGSSTGWGCVDELYTVMPGELTIVTGIPGHGKSEFIDALVLKLAQEHGWGTAFCSPENLPVTRHLMKLLEKQVGGPFYDKGPRARMTEYEMIDGLEFIHQHVTLIAPDESLTIPDLLTKAKALVFQRGVRGLVLDPWNEFDHKRAPGLSETEHVSASLGLLRRFARTHGVHVWVVAHPAKMQKNLDDKYPVPRPYDISGSAHWYNRADNCLSVWRDVGDPEKRHEVEVHIQKVRNKHVGTVGMTTLLWDSITGRLYEKRSGA
jgi:twinkle protein